MNTMTRLMRFLPLLLVGAEPASLWAAPDIQRYALSLEITPQSLYTQATAELEVLNPAGAEPVSQVVLDFVGFTLGAVSWNGQSTGVSYLREGSTLTVTLASPLAAGQRGTLKLTYQGTPEPYVTAQGELGVMQDRSVVYAINVTEGARYWFPCRDRLDDKASASLELILPAGYTSAGPGSLTGVVPLSGGKEAHRWVMTQPVTPYLLSFAFSERFVRERYDLGLRSGPRFGDFVLLADSWPDAETDLLVVPDIVDWLEQRYGLFPYDQVGLHEIPFQGAVEQPGNIAMGSFYLAGTGQFSQYFAHELSHTWFQGLVTIRTWNDIFLSESLAVWHELLWTEQQEGLAAADVMAKTNLDAYRVGMSSEGVFPISEPTELFGYTVYFKGSLVWRLLEHLMGREALLAELKGYLQDGDGIADLADFFARPVFGTNPVLQNFRAEWVDRAGLPGYRFGWKATEGTNGTSVAFRLAQEREPYYTTPLDVRLTYADGTQENLTLTPTSNDHVVEVCLAQMPTEVVLDPRYLVPRGQEGSVTAPSSSLCDEDAPSCSAQVKRLLPEGGEGVGWPSVLPVVGLGVLSMGWRRRARREAQRRAYDSIKVRR